MTTAILVVLADLIHLGGDVVALLAKALA